MKLLSASAIERLPWPMRALLGGASAAIAVVLTDNIAPLRSFPLLLAFAMVILTCWFFGMAGGVVCAFTEALLVDAFLTRTQFRFSIGNTTESIRLIVFLTLSILLGWTIRRLAQ